VSPIVFNDIYLDRIKVNACQDYDLEFNNIMNTRNDKFQSIKANKKLKDVSAVLEFKLLVEFVCFIAFLVLVFLNLIYYERHEYYRYSVVYVSLSILLLLILSVMQVSVFNDYIFKTEGDLFVKTKLAVSILGFSPTTSLVISISFTSFLNLFNFLYTNYNLCTAM
jgi:membrane-associated HD superfamily phosphohydrolase